MDMFEPQDHPNDFRYPGGPPIPPYDITGWTLAMQMGVQFDRIRDGFDGPFTRINGILPPPADSVTGVSSPAGYLISHRINNSFILINRLLKADADVYWLKKEQTAEGQELGTGSIWVPASAAARPVLEKGAKELGVPVHAVAKAPSGEALKLKPIRIGLYDSYGGNMPAGWTQWLFQQYEFPFQMVYPPTLDEGNLQEQVRRDRVHRWRDSPRRRGRRTWGRRRTRFRRQPAERAGAVSRRNRPLQRRQNVSAASEVRGGRRVGGDHRQLHQRG